MRVYVCASERLIFYFFLFAQPIWTVFQSGKKAKKMRLIEFPIHFIEWNFYDTIKTLNGKSVYAND